MQVKYGPLGLYREERLHADPRIWVIPMFYDGRRGISLLTWDTEAALGFARRKDLSSAEKYDAECKEEKNILFGSDHEQNDERKTTTKNNNNGQ